MADSNAPTQSDQPGILSKALKVLTIPISAVAGYWFGSTSIRNSAYDNAKFMGAVDSISTPHRTTLQEIGAEANAVTKAGGKFNLGAKIQPLFDAHTPRVTERLENLELGTLRKQWNFTSKYQKQQALMNGFTAAGIAIGAMFAVANSKWLSHALNKQDAEQKAEQGPSV